MVMAISFSLFYNKYARLKLFWGLYSEYLSRESINHASRGQVKIFRKFLRVRRVVRGRRGENDRLGGVRTRTQ